MIVEITLQAKVFRVPSSSYVSRLFAVTLWLVWEVPLSSTTTDVPLGTIEPFLEWFISWCSLSQAGLAEQRASRKPELLALGKAVVVATVARGQLRFIKKYNS